MAKTHRKRKPLSFSQRTTNAHIDNVVHGFKTETGITLSALAGSVFEFLMVFRTSKKRRKQKALKTKAALVVKSIRSINTSLNEAQKRLVEDVKQLLNRLCPSIPIEHS